MTEATRSRSPLRLAFLASLAVNLFLIGLVGGQLLFGGDEEETNRPRNSWGYSIHPRLMMEALPEDRHDDIQAYWAGSRQGMGRKWREINAIRREIDTTLRAEPFDPDALLAAQRRESEAREALRMDRNADAGAFLATMTAAERKAIADLARARLEEQREYWRERRRRREEAAR